MKTYKSVSPDKPEEWEYNDPICVFHHYNIAYNEQEECYDYNTDSFLWPEYYKYMQQQNEEKITELQLAAAEMYESLQE